MFLTLKQVWNGYFLHVETPADLEGNCFSLNHHSDYYICAFVDQIYTL